MLATSCTFIGICLFLFGSSGNSLCILVFLRQKFRYRIITPYFITLLFADSIYLLFRLIKLLYYSQTLFRLHSYREQTCSNTSFVRMYAHATQLWPQTLVPLVHSETYIRFSLILMSIMSVQRSTFIDRSLKFLVLPSTSKETSKHKWSLFWIVLAFLFAYTFEFAGLTLFCSERLSPQIVFNWFTFLTRQMANSTTILTDTLKDKPQAFRCVNYAIKIFQNNSTSILPVNSICSHEQLMNILNAAFDEHQRPIVNLIQKIVWYQTKQMISRNEIRRKYHFHECLFPQDAEFFHRHYDFMFSRIFGFNRHTLLLVFGSVLPSLITIVGNLLSACRVHQLNHLTSALLLPCRRRTDDTRRILLVITVECLFAIVNSWFSDILLALIYCKRNLSAGDDCPDYLKKNYDLLVLFDLFNSVSNIVLHCLCGRRFRCELRRMFQSFFSSIKQFVKSIRCCYCHIQWRRSLQQEPCAAYNATLTQHDSSNSSSQPHVHLKIKPSSSGRAGRCCNCRWYFTRRPLNGSQRCLTTVPKECSQKNGTPYNAQYQSSTQRSYVTRPTQGPSIKLYYPIQPATSANVNKHYSSLRR